jgi:hypothetical protein
MPASFAKEMDPAFLPIDVIQTKMHDITGSESEACEQQQNDTIPTATTCRAIACINETFDISGIQVSR